MLDRLNSDKVLFVRVSGSDGEDAWVEADEIVDLEDLIEPVTDDEIENETISILEDYIELQRELKEKIILDKPTIPKYVAEFIESFDRTDSLFLDKELVESASNSTEALIWQSNNAEKFSVAWLYEYNVEE